MSLEYYTTYASPPPSILEPDEDFAPPEYTPSSDSPVYSAEPGPSEERLALTSRRSARRPPPTTALTRSNIAISVALLGQEAGASAPIYGSQATICGDIGLKDAHAIQEVRVKVSPHQWRSHPTRFVDHPVRSRGRWSSQGAITPATTPPFSRTSTRYGRPMIRPRRRLHVRLSFRSKSPFLQHVATTTRALCRRRSTSNSQASRASMWTAATPSRCLQHRHEASSSGGHTKN